MFEVLNPVLWFELLLKFVHALCQSCIVHVSTQRSELINHVDFLVTRHTWWNKALVTTVWLFKKDTLNNEVVSRNETRLKNSENDLRPWEMNKNTFAWSEHGWTNSLRGPEAKMRSLAHIKAPSSPHSICIVFPFSLLKYHSASDVLCCYMIKH